MLDVDHGTYPFVTSSNTLAAAGGARRRHRPGRGRLRARHHQGLHDAGRRGPLPDRARTTRSASGLGERGREFGTVTGRPRRCGWFDAVLVRQAVKIGGIHGLALTKLDVLDGMRAAQDLHRATGIAARRLHHLPAAMTAQAGVEPVYEELDGWQESTRGARSFADLPAQAVKYVKRLEELVEAPVAMLSTSPDRDDTILLRDPFAD